MALEIKKQIYDSVHGYIGLTDVELKVINSPLFQRLKSITCLGTVNFVYPGATNNRLEHSLGTMFMMQQFLSHVRVNGSIVDDKDTVQMMRLAALLHDIGHYPLSHTTEHVIMKKLGGRSHEEFGKQIIKRFFSEELSGYNMGEITKVISGGEGGDMGMLLSSAFDADKADYLLRDAYHTGVGYGNVGIQRLIRIASFEKGRIVFDKDEAAVESFLLGRYHMFRSVYHHKTSVAFELMIERIFELLVEEGAIKHPNDLYDSGNAMDFLAYDDHMLYASMHAYLNKGGNAFLKDLIRMFLLRKPISVAYINPLPEDGEDTSEENKMIKGMAYNEARIKEFSARMGIDESDWIFPVYLRPLGIIDDKSPIYIRDSGSVSNILKSNGLIMQMIGKKKLYDARIYTHPKYKTKLSKAMAALRSGSDASA